IFFNLCIHSRRSRLRYIINIGRTYWLKKQRNVTEHSHQVKIISGAQGFHFSSEPCFFSSIHRNARKFLQQNIRSENSLIVIAPETARNCSGVNRKVGKTLDAIPSVGPPPPA